MQARHALVLMHRQTLLQMQLYELCSRSVSVPSCSVKRGHAKAARTCDRLAEVHDLYCGHRYRSCVKDDPSLDQPSPL